MNRLFLENVATFIGEEEEEKEEEGEEEKEVDGGDGVS